MLLYLTYCKPVIIAEGAATTAYDHLRFVSLSQTS